MRAHCFTKVALHTELLHTELVHIGRSSRPGDFLVERREVFSRVIHHFSLIFSAVLIFESKSGVVPS